VKERIVTLRKNSNPQSNTMIHAMMAGAIIDQHHREKGIQQTLGIKIERPLL